ncbi:hypothetical protein IIC65_02605 [Candidatus Sumerlaeota bacterium]|nr:hypothetical protein [Candidatus Sumerlaeota bacterium]
MRKTFLLAIAAVLVLHGSQSGVAQQESNPAGQARQVIVDLFEAFNGHDSDGYYATFHYPQVSVSAGGALRISESPPEGGMNFAALAEREGWHHSVLDSASVLDAAADKVHFDVRFTRFKADGSAYSKYRGLWIITRRDGRWAVQVRSFMPTERLIASQ